MVDGWWWFIYQKNGRWLANRLKHRGSWVHHPTMKTITGKTTLGIGVSNEVKQWLIMQLLVDRVNLLRYQVNEPWQKTVGSLLAWKILQNEHVVFFHVSSWVSSAVVMPKIFVNLYPNKIFEIRCWMWKEGVATFFRQNELLSMQARFFEVRCLSIFLVVARRSLLSMQAPCSPEPQAVHCRLCWILASIWGIDLQYRSH